MTTFEKNSYRNTI